MPDRVAARSTKGPAMGAWHLWQVVLLEAVIAVAVAGLLWAAWSDPRAAHGRASAGPHFSGAFLGLSPADRIAMIPPPSDPRGPVVGLVRRRPATPRGRPETTSGVLSVKRQFASIASAVVIALASSLVSAQAPMAVPPGQV